jgi:NAD(P)-dependent dehydrogenase (short-subunit alcohol dehydrogenase family)
MAHEQLFLHERTPLIPISFDAKTSSVMGKGITPIGRAAQPSEVLPLCCVWAISQQCCISFMFVPCSTEEGYIGICTFSQVAPAFVLLASDDASYMTGSILAVTGGMHTN